MQKEIKPSHENHVFELVKLRKSKRALNNKWVFRLKIEKKNYSQPSYKAISIGKRVLIFKKIFLPIFKISLIRIG
jgi:hypothetical protein